MSPKGSYFYPVNEVEDETIVNRSRFICYLRPCYSPEQAKEMVDDIKLIHPSAGHHCYAFISDSPSNSQCYGFSDDGEPGGTAGKPMLIALQGSELGNICAVVVRYFGGIKLGTGGLQRAYGGSVRKALDSVESKQSIPTTLKRLKCSYADSAQLDHFLKRCEATIKEQDFSQEVTLILAIPDHQIDNLQQMLTTFSAGLLKLEKIN